MADNRTNRTQSHTTKTEYVPIHRRRWFWPPAIAAGLVLVFSFIASLFAIGMAAHHLDRDRGGLAGLHQRGLRAGGPIGLGDRISGSQNHLFGVVTSVNGSSFTLAGNGSTNDVETNSSTQYQNGSQVKVNDSVVVLGTTNNGKFTASRIFINPLKL